MLVNSGKNPLRKGTESLENPFLFQMDNQYIGHISLDIY
jgi:hypothetical protein